MQIPSSRFPYPPRPSNDDAITRPYVANWLGKTGAIVVRAGVTRQRVGRSPAAHAPSQRNAMLARHIAVHFGDKTWMRWISIQYGLFCSTHGGAVRGLSRHHRHGDAETPGVTKTCDAAFAGPPQMASMSEVSLGPLFLG